LISIYSQVTSLGLINFNSLKESFEVTGTKSIVVLSLNEFNK